MMIATHTSPQKELQITTLGGTLTMNPDRYWFYSLQIWMILQTYLDKLVYNNSYYRTSIVLHCCIRLSSIRHLKARCLYYHSFL